jgi:hypothetical protein
LETTATAKPGEKPKAILTATGLTDLTPTRKLQELMDLIGSLERKRVVVLATAQYLIPERDRHDLEESVPRLRGMAGDYQDIIIVTDGTSDEDLFNLLQTTDVLYVCGGNLGALSRLNFRIKRLIKSRVDRGLMLYVGSSAGAMFALRSRYNRWITWAGGKGYTPGLKQGDLLGLGLPGIVMIPHPDEGLKKMAGPLTTLFSLLGKQLWLLEEGEYYIIK